MARALSWIVSLLVVSASPAAAAVGPDHATVEILTQLATVAAAKIEGAEVLSAKDLQDMLALEADKELMGCDDAGACLAEVAGALGARLVVFGQVGQLDDVLVLTLNLYDAQSGRSSGRSVVRAGSVAALGDKVEQAVEELVGDAVARIAAASAAPAEDDDSAAPAARVRVLVMNLSVAGGNAAPPEEPPPSSLSLPWLAVAGGGIAVAGTMAFAGGIVGGVLANAWDSEARHEETLQSDVPALAQQRDTAGYVTPFLLIGGAVAVVGGGALLAIGLLGDE